MIGDGGKPKFARAQNDGRIQLGGGGEGQNLHNTKGNRKKILQEGKPKLSHIVGVNTY
jgi:hypothetical protein